jgi:hypothetical protein
LQNGWLVLSWKLPAGHAVHPSVGDDRELADITICTTAVRNARGLLKNELARATNCCIGKLLLDTPKAKMPGWAVRASS